MTGNFQEGLHLVTKPGITQLLMASSAEHLIQTTIKTKAQKQSPADRTSTDTPKYTSLHNSVH